MIEKLVKFLKYVKSKRSRTKQKELLSSEFDLLVGPLHAFICFKDAEYFGCKTLKEGFRHCFVILKTEIGWININPTRNLLFASISDCGINDPYIEILKKNAEDMKIVEVIVKNHFSNMITLNMLTCVTVVKYVLGLKFRAFSAVTPHQLYKRLIAGAHPNIIKVREIPKWNLSQLREDEERLNRQQRKPGLKRHA